MQPSTVHQRVYSRARQSKTKHAEACTHPKQVHFIKIRRHRATSKCVPMPTSLHTHKYTGNTYLKHKCSRSTLRSTKLPGRFPTTPEVVEPGASIRAVGDPSLARGLLLPPLPSSSPGASLVTRSHTPRPAPTKRCLLASLSGLRLGLRLSFGVGVKACEKHGQHWRRNNMATHAENDHQGHFAKGIA